MTPLPRAAATALTLLAASFVPSVGSASPPLLRLDPATVAAGAWVDLPAEWAYQAGPARPSAAAEESATTRRGEPGLPRGRMPPDWPGEGWFWLDLEIPPDLAEVPLTLIPDFTGAAELELGATPLARWGQLPTAGAGTVTVMNPPPVSFTAPAGRHRLRVHLAHPDADRFHRAGWNAGLHLQLGRADHAARGLLRRERVNAGRLWGFTGIFVAFGVLHLALFLFARREREHLHFALLCAAAAGLVFFLLVKNGLTNPRFVLFSEPAMSFLGLAFALAELRLLYSLFRPHLPRRFWVFVAVAVALAAASLPAPATVVGAVFLFMLITNLELVREVAAAVWRRQPGSVVLGAGLVLLAGGFTIGLLGNLGWIPKSPLTSVVLPFSGMVALIVAMSLSLSQRYAATHQELARNLEEVERLSREALEQERRAQREEAERRLLEAEVRRKNEELEAARALQLALLPSPLPQPAGYALAARMLTATEVGGDTYDAVLGADGCLTLTIGDATGHGAQAGVMVAAYKSLFATLAEAGPGEGRLAAALGDASRALKRIGWRRMAMAANLLRLEGGRVQLAGAGMPPAFVHRALTGEVQPFDAGGGVPLGALAAPRYAEESFELGPGDCLLLVSDGFIERRDPAGEDLGFPGCARIFAALAGASLDAPLVDRVNQLADALLQAALAHGGDAPLDDDVTVVVLARAAA